MTKAELKAAEHESPWLMILPKGENQPSGEKHAHGKSATLTIRRRQKNSGRTMNASPLLSKWRETN